MPGCQCTTFVVEKYKFLSDPFANSFLSLRTTLTLKFPKTGETADIRHHASCAFPEVHATLSKSYAADAIK